jgi:hypothetical protein
MISAIVFAIPERIQIQAHQVLLKNQIPIVRAHRKQQEFNIGHLYVYVQDWGAQLPEAHPTLVHGRRTHKQTPLQHVTSQLSPLSLALPVV